MPDLAGVIKRVVESEMCFSTAVQHNSKFSNRLNQQSPHDSFCSILPGLPDDIAMFCLALIPRKYTPIMGAVCKRWRMFIQSKDFIPVRKETGMLEEWLYFLTSDLDGKGSHWEVMSSLEGKTWMLPPMPGSVKTGFSTVVFDGKLLVIGGFSMNDGIQSTSADAYQYDTRLNSYAFVSSILGNFIMALPTFLSLRKGKSLVIVFFQSSCFQESCLLASGDGFLGILFMCLRACGAHQSSWKNIPQLSN